jgi:glycosyltransferase involved in cell wall biosynthesis
MNICIDISSVVYGEGVSEYTRNLVISLLKNKKKNDFSFFFSSMRKNLSFPEIGKGQIKKYRFPPTFLDILWNKLHVFNIEKFVGKVDVFHASDWTQPPAKNAKLVTTIHDLSFLRWSESVHPKVLAVHKNRLKWVEKEASQIIAVSEATKKEIVKLLSIPAEKITVIPESVPQDVLTFKIPGKERLEKIKKRYKVSKPFFFAYGSQAPRKNIDNLINGFKDFNSAKKYQLVIAGRWKKEKTTDKNILSTGFLPRNEMLSLFSISEGFLYPSLYEGFGLPILEGFALKVPVLTSIISSMPEVAGKAAILVDPKSVSDISLGIKNLIDKKGNLVKLGEERLKSFSWDKTSKETIKVYEKAYKG